MPDDTELEVYLVEIYQAGFTEADASSWIAGLDADDRERDAVHVVRSLLVPRDGWVMCELSGPSLEAVEAACARAHVPVDRVSPAVIREQAARRPREEQG